MKKYRRLLFIACRVLFVSVTGFVVIKYTTSYHESPNIAAIKPQDMTVESTAKAAPAEPYTHFRSDDYERIKADYEEICARYETTGMSLAVFKGQKILYTQSYGYADKAAGIRADDNTKFRIASISKTITGIMAMQLAAEGKLDLDADISDVLGFTVRSGSYPDEPITTRQLLTHTSGICDGAAYTNAENGGSFPSLKTMLRSGCFTGNKPGSTYLYSNFGAGVVTAVIESVTKQRFTDYAKKELFDPLGMDAAYLTAQIRDNEHIAQIYSGGCLNGKVKTWTGTINLCRNMPIGQMYLLGHSNLIISAKDLAKFGMVLAGDGACGGQTVLPLKSVDEMNAVHFRDSTVERGLALSISDRIVDGRTLRGHPGQAYGMVAGLYYDPSDHTGIAFITNGCHTGKNKNGIYNINDAVVRYTYATFFGLR